MTNTTLTTTDLTRLLVITLGQLERMTAAARVLAVQREQALAMARTLQAQRDEAEAEREQAIQRERAAGADMVVVVNAAAAYLAAMTWSPSQDPKWKPGDGIIDYKTPEDRLKKLIKGPGRPGVALLTEMTILRELSADVARWRESSDARDLAYILETADKYDAMKASE